MVHTEINFGECPQKVKALVDLRKQGLTHSLLVLAKFIQFWIVPVSKERIDVPQRIHQFDKRIVAAYVSFKFL